MIDMTIDMTVPASRSHNHFHGNGNCDATREANHRADRATGMESEIAPYYGAMPQPQSGGMAGRAMAQQHQQAAMPDNTAVQRRGTMTESAANGYNDPTYGLEHEWTGEQEEGMNSIPQDSFTKPLDADEAARNSWRALLARNVGRSVLVRFLMGTQNLITVEGELYEVGTDYIVIYQPLWDSHITADLYSVKFVEFREPPGVMTLN